MVLDEWMGDKDREAAKRDEDETLKLYPNKNTHLPLFVILIKYLSSAI